MADAIRYRVSAEIARMTARRHQVVEASAGTGKTYLLEHRFVGLLLATDVDIDQILVVTFTDKATAELRRRVRELLHQIVTCTASTAGEDEPHWLIGASERARLAAALASFDRAAISTIHGFCHRLLGENAFAGGRLFQQTQVSTDAAFERAFVSCLRDTYAVAEPYLPYLEHWFLSDKKDPIHSLQLLLRECHISGGRIVPALDPDALSATIGALAPHTTEAGVAAVEATVRAAKVHGGTRNALLSRLRDLGQGDRLAGGSPSQQCAAVCAHLKVLDWILERRDKIAAASELVAAVERVRAAAVPLAAAVAGSFLPVVRERMRTDKLRRGQFDFHDMLELVWEMLASPGGQRLASKIRDRYPFALVDEFQDTDPLQWKIFSAIYVGADTEGYLTIVGDPKQAIYGFRGADLHSYFEAADTLAREGAGRTSLRVNYRSTPRLISAVNQLLASGPEPLFAGELDCTADPAPTTDWDLLDASGQPIAPLEIMDLEPGERLVKAQEADELIAGHIAARIRALLTEPAASLVQRVNGKLTPVAARDIYVLTRKSKEAQEMADALRDRGIPCALFRQIDLLATREAREVRDLLAGIANPLSRSARARAWATRFFGLELSELHGLGEVRDEHPLVDRLHRWKQQADEQAYEQLFASILSDSGFVERELFTSTSQRAIINVEHLFELLLEEVGTRRGDLHALLRTLQAWIDDRSSDGGNDRAQRMESEADAVQIMTVHKAKGLQAGVVFLYGGLSGFGSSVVRRAYLDGERVTCVDDARSASRLATEAEQVQEDQRLLYVALTRARGLLCVPRVPEQTMSASCFLRQLNPRLSDERLVELGELCRVTALSEQPDTHGEQSASVLANWSPPTALLSPLRPASDCSRISRTRSGAVVTSYTRLQSRMDSGADEPEGVAGSALSDIDAAGDGPEAEVAGLPGGRAVGIFLHEVAEKLSIEQLRDGRDYDRWRADPAVARLFSDSMNLHGISSAHLDEAMAMIYGSLTTEIAAEGQRLPAVVDADRVAREVAFLYPLVGHGEAESGLVRGSIDLLLETGSRTYVLDWKSDRLPDYSQSTLRQHFEAHYQIQSTLYSLALVRLLRRGGRGDIDQRFGGVIYFFMRGQAVHFERPSIDELERTAVELASGGWS